MNEQTIQEMIDELKFIIVILQRELKKTKKDSISNDQFTNQKTYDIDKMMKGFSRQKLNLIRSIKEAIKEFTDKGGSAPKTSVIEQLVKKGISFDELEPVFTLLINTGEIVETGPDRFKVI